MDAVRLAEMLKNDNGPGIGIRQGNVTAYNSTTKLASITIGGSETVLTGIRHPTSYTPVVGHSVFLVVNGADLFILGRLATSDSPPVPRMAAGVGSVTPATSTAADAMFSGSFFTGSTAVSFPAGRFSAAPVVTVTGDGVFPHRFALSVSSITTSGFTVTCSRSFSVTTSFYWTAVQV